MTSAQGTIFRVSATPDSSGWRHLRIRYTPNDELTVIGGYREPNPDYSDFSPEGVRRIQSSDHASRYSPSSVCIYCGAKNFRPGTTTRLSDEHVVAEGLGSRLILPEASCERCGQRTCSVEGHVLREMLPARIGLGVRRKARKRAGTFALRTEVGGQSTSLELPESELPTMLLVPELRAPRVFSPRAPHERNVAGVFAHNDFSLTDFIGTDAALFSPELDTLRFCQMLAKIAHCFACAEVGRGNFRPLVNQFAVRKYNRSDDPTDHYEYIGGFPVWPLRPSEALHELVLRTERWLSHEYLVVTIRLFSKVGTPAYDVVAGEL